MRLILKKASELFTLATIPRQVYFVVGYGKIAIFC